MTADLAEAATMPRPRVVLLMPGWYSPFDVLSYDLKNELRELGQRVAETLRLRADIRGVQIISSRHDGIRAAEQARHDDSDVLLVLQTVVAPPAYVLELLRWLPDRPVVIWAAHRRTRIDASYDHEQIAADGATVGTPMLTNMLVRDGRPFELIVGPVDDIATVNTVECALRAARAAARLARARIGRVGRPIDGYDCVDADDDALAADLGTRVVAIAPSEFQGLYLAVSRDRVAELDRQTRCGFDIDIDPGEEGYLRSLRAACALEDLVTRHRLDAGAMNCHVPEIRLGVTVGIAPCFALGRLTSAGVPWTCSGDVLTAVAMLVLKLLGAAALYHELEAINYSQDEFVIANTGEHDLTLAASQRPGLIENRWYRGDPHRGVCACFSAQAGAATLVAFTQLPTHPRHRLIVARGEFTGSSWPQVGTPNAGFRFASGAATTAWAAWCRAGANHHAAATRGDLIPAIDTVARLLGVEVVHV